MPLRSRGPSIETRDKYFGPESCLRACLAIVVETLYDVEIFIDVA
jgi:hypothetical protein